MFSPQELLLAAGIGAGFFSFFHPSRLLRPLALFLCVLSPLSPAACLVNVGLLLAVFYISRVFSYDDAPCFWIQLAVVSLPLPLIPLWLLLFAALREPALLLPAFYCVALLWR